MGEGIKTKESTGGAGGGSSSSRVGSLPAEMSKLLGGRWPWKHANEGLVPVLAWLSLEKWRRSQRSGLLSQTPSLLAWLSTTLRTGMKAEVSLKLLVLTM